MGTYRSTVTSRLAQENLVAIFFKRRPLLRVLDFGGPLQAGFDGAKPLDQILRGFLADARRAGNIVGRVAPETQQVRDLFGHHPEEFLDFVAIDEQVVFRGVEDQDGVDELVEVLVERHHDGEEALLDRAGRDRRNDVVRFVAGRVQRGNAHRLAELPDVGNLLRQVRGHLLPGRLVEFVLRVAQGRRGTVEGDRDVFGRILLQDTLQHDREAVHGVGGHALGCRETLDREVRAIRLRHSIDNQKEWMLDHEFEL